MQGNMTTRTTTRTTCCTLIQLLLLVAQAVWIVSAFTTTSTTCTSRIRRQRSLFVAAVNVFKTDQDQDDVVPHIVQQESIQQQQSTTTATTASIATSSMPVLPAVVYGVTPRTGPLNEAVSRIANVSLEHANQLIRIGAVWAQMERLTSDDLLQQYHDNNNNNNKASSKKGKDASGRLLYADLPSRMIGNNNDSNKSKNNNKNNKDTQRQQANVHDDDDDDDYDESNDDGVNHGDSSTSQYDDDDDDDEDENDDDDDAHPQQPAAPPRFRRILSPTYMEAGTALRIYPQPRRFPACYTMTRSTSILYEDTTYIVVDKPPMLPTQPDASNFYECCPACVESILLHDDDHHHQDTTTSSSPSTSLPLPPIPSDNDNNNSNQNHRPLLCHRVDTCVGGCVVLSKTTHGQRVFQHFQRQRQVRKMYLAITTTPVPLGMHYHWMWSSQTTLRGKVGGPPCQLVRHTPPETRRKAKQFWTRCVLEVTKCEPISIDIGTTTGHDDGTTTSSTTTPQQQYYQSTIRLVTGRKHQVRAQLASLACPILFDTLYQPMAGLTLDGLSSSATTASDEDALDRAIQQCRVPTRPIGLQAHAISFGGIRVKARTPWWAK